VRSRTLDRRTHPESSRARPKPYRELVANYLFDLVCVPLRIQRFRPLITNFYLTKRCNLRCRYCYPPGNEPELDGAAAIKLLEKIRPHNPVLNLTGGEPLLHKDFRMILRGARQLRFYPILLSTNGLLVDRFQDDLEHIDHLIITLHSPNPDINDVLTGVPGATAQIIRNIRLCAGLAAERDFSLTLHAVITSETLEEIERTLALCEEIGATLAVSPEHGTFHPSSDLPGNPRYNSLIDRLLELKAGGKPVASSSSYLRMIRDFSPHRCYPHISPRVEPDGRVYFPCQRIMQRAVHLQDYPSLARLMTAESKTRPADPDCCRRCFLACYLEVDRYINNPASLLREEVFRGWIRGRMKGGRKNPWQGS
jgi:MoaA/NifB/PqqE/SkfB family radical SAM enzyme